MPWKLENLKAWLSRRKATVAELTCRRATISDACEILGKKRVFDAAFMKVKFEISKVPKLLLPYSVEAVAQCAELNKQGHQWILICKMKLSFLQLRERFPSDFSRSSVWDRELTPAWLSEESDAEYRLVNLLPAYCGEAQAFDPAAFGEGDYARAKALTVAQALVAFKIRHKGYPYAFVDQCHCGYQRNGTPSGSIEIPIIGGYDGSGMLLYTLPPEPAVRFGVDRIGMALCRVPDKA